MNISKTDLSVNRAVTGPAKVMPGWFDLPGKKIKKYRRFKSENNGEGAVLNNQ
jgi:hypothetical protein